MILMKVIFDDIGSYLTSLYKSTMSYLTLGSIFPYFPDAGTSDRISILIQIVIGLIKNLLNIILT
jgi:hypothetical protein